MREHRWSGGVAKSEREGRKEGKAEKEGAGCGKR